MTITYGANTISRANGLVADLYITEVIDSAVLEASYSATVMEPLVRHASIADAPTNTMKFPRWPALTAAAIAETADLAQTALDTTSITVAVGEVGIQLAITDVLQEDDSIAGYMEYGRQGGLALADKRDADLAALLSGHSNTTGDETGSLTEELLLEAISELDSRDAPKPDGGYVGVFHPRQLAGLGKSIVTSGGNIYSGASTERFGSRPRGYWGTLFGIDLFQTTNVPTGTRNSVATYEGAVFAKGMAHVMLDKRQVRTEIDRDPSARLTEINITSRYGVGELVDAWGETVYSNQTIG